ncbi:M4 family metallopeptidase [Streptomyces kunmingensis]|uniref:Neutral metalloproteinase n=1 Tax=Streptomyces kunmingensis TaxID=68225 RepID=A0ABU6CIF7_9ACTN|nr:M4 family metallopeptidase [Streptomyces kunmingensis]MEB3964499.1 M4 family metallopeptidase [Streptomyces kunmingensis]
MRPTRTTIAAAACLLATALTPTATASASPTPPPTRTNTLAAAATALTTNAAALDLTPAQTPSVRDVIVDEDGTQHVRYDRTFRHLPVLGGDFVVHLTRSGTYKGADRATQGTLEVPSTTPRVKAPKAADLAAQALRTANPGTTLSRLLSKPLLVVDALHGAPTLAWRTDTTAKDSLGNPVSRVVLTDALTGKQMDAWDGIETASGDGRSLYSGTVPLETTRSGTSYQLKDATRGGTYTGDAQNKTDLCILGICLSRAPATLYSDADNRWGSGANADRASAAVDAQYGTDQTWDYYKQVHNRNGIAGDGKGSYNRVHYGNKYNNAFWDDSCFCMTYGDGDGTTFGPLVALDVAGHEMTHGVTSKTAALTYSGESGGLNEATSDIFGTLVEFHADNASDPGDWRIGEKLVKPGFGKAALRFMDRPSKDGSSPDCWSSSVGNLDVHYSSGIANHFAYLLAEGTGTKVFGGVEHTGTTCDGTTLAGIGKEKLGKIWYRALTVYMTSSTKYAGARTATLSAAKDLYGAGSAEYAAVTATWSAVSVN